MPAVDEVDSGGEDISEEADSAFDDASVSVFDANETADVGKKFHIRERILK